MRHHASHTPPVTDPGAQPRRIPASRGGAERAETLRLTDPLRTRVDDELLAIRVHNRLLAELKFEALPIRVTAAGGVVSLSGALKLRSTIDRAQWLARSVEGVVRLKNRLTIAPPGAAEHPAEAAAGDDSQEIADSVLETRIRRKLVGMFGAGAFDVGVVATDGMIVLSGEVPDSTLGGRMVRMTRAVNGVDEVHDLLTVPGHAKH